MEPMWDADGDWEAGVTGAVPKFESEFWNKKNTIINKTTKSINIYNLLIITFYVFIFIYFLILCSSM